MIRRCSLWVSALLAFALTLPVEANELEGVWLFQKEINTTVSGEVVKVRGPQYQGILIYTADGHVSANVLPKSRAWKVDTASLEELRQTVGQGSSTGYAGRYQIDANAKTVTHIPLVSLDPADEGQELVRGYALKGNVLELSGTWTYEGRQLTFTVRWIRADSRGSADD
jgi:hypothetical protein